MRGREDRTEFKIGEDRKRERGRGVEQILKPIRISY